MDHGTSLAQFMAVTDAADEDLATGFLEVRSWLA
jgi:hypothetical protein